MDEDVPRRIFLAGGSTLGAIAIAGCSDLSGSDTDDDEEADETDGDAHSPEEEESDAEPSTDAKTDDSEESANDPPEIIKYSVEPTDHGTTLLVTLEGEDNLGIERAAISYGDLGIEETPEDTAVTVEGELTDIHEAAIEETPGTVVFTLEDVEDEVTQEEERPHFGSPSVSVRTAATASPGELQIEIEAEDDIGLHWVEVEINGESIEEFETVGADETELNIILNNDETILGEANDVKATVRNTFGNTLSRSQDQYVRKHEPLEGHELDLAATVVPITYREYEQSWEECTDARPAVGTYDLGDIKAINRHVDQMQGFGINRYQYDFRAPDAIGPFEEYIGAEMLQKIDFEVLWPIGNPFEWRLAMDDWTAKRIVDWCVDYIREEFLTLANYGTQDGRPVVTLHDYRSLTWNDTFAEAIEAEWGSFDEFTAYLKEELTVNGTEPYIIAGAKHFGRGYREGHASDDDIDLLEPADGVTHWTGLVRDNETVTQAEHKEFHQENMEGLLAFAADYDMEFIPSVTPGFNERHSECFPGENPERHVPRSPAYFAELFDLADEYRTTDRIHISSYNDWNEGHQIEPGTFDGEEYGTDYLEVVKEFAQGGSR